MRLKAYNLKLLLHTYYVIIGPIEKFLWSLKVATVGNFRSQKVLKIMNFKCLRRSVGRDISSWNISSDLQSDYARNLISEGME